MISRGPVTINDRAFIDGAVRSGGAVTRSPNGGSTVTGGVFLNQSLTFPPPLTVVNDMPGTNNGNIDIQPDRTLAVAPGAYNLLNIASRSTAQTLLLGLHALSCSTHGGSASGGPDRPVPADKTEALVTGRL